MARPLTDQVQGLDDGVARRRTLEVVVALAIVATGVVVTAGSLSHDVGWNANGPGAGYFPFRVGLLLILCGGSVGAMAWRARSSEPFVTRPALARTVSVFVPTVAFAAGMVPLGAYVASFLFLLFMMRRHGAASWRRAVGMALAVVFVLFVVFERWFRVPLAKGPLEALLGIY